MYIINRWILVFFILASVPLHKGCSSPEDAQKYQNEGMNKLKAGNYEGAIKDFTKAINSDSSRVDFYNNRAFARYKAGDMEGSVEDYTTHLEKSPEDESSFNNRLSIRKKLNDYEAIESDYTTALSSIPFEFSMDEKKIDKLRAAGLPDEVISKLHKRSAYSTRVSMDNTKEAYERYKKEKRYYLRHLTEKIGQIYADQYESLIVKHALEPRLASMYNSRGINRMELKRFEDAELDFTKAIELNPEYVDAYSNLSAILGLSKKYDEAIALLTKAIEISPKYVAGYFNRGVFKNEIGDTEGGCADIYKAKEISRAEISSMDAALIEHAISQNCE